MNNITTERLLEIRSTLQRRENMNGHLTARDALAKVAVTKELDERHRR